MPVLKKVKREKFAQELAMGSTAEVAYKRAGYTPSAANAQKLKCMEVIRKRVEELQAIGAEKAGVTIQHTIEELRKVAFSDITKAVSWGGPCVVTRPDGDESEVVHDVALVPSDELDDDTARAISEVRKTKDGLSIKFHDKLAALEKLGRYLGMFKDKVDVGNKPGEPLIVKWID